MDLPFVPQRPAEIVVFIRTEKAYSTIKQEA